MKPASVVGAPLKNVWFLIPLLLVVLGVAYWFSGSDPEERGDVASVTVLSESDDAQWLRLPTVVAAGEVGSRYVEPADALRAGVLQNLAQFRVNYQQLAPYLKVKAAPGLENGQRLAQQLGSVLAHYGLGRTAASDAQSLPDKRRALLVLRGARKDAEIIRRLLAALSPYLSGEVLVQFDDARRIDQLELYLLGEPGFTKTGVAVFSNRGEPNAEMP